MSTLGHKSTASVTLWANEHGWRLVRRLLIYRSSLLVNCKWPNAAAIALVGRPHREVLARLVRVVLQSTLCKHCRAT